MNFVTDQPSLTSLCGIYAENTSRLIFVTGAGCSAYHDCPTWPKLKELMLLALKHYGDSLQGDSRGKARAAFELARLEDNLWVAFEIIKNNLLSNTFQSQVRLNIQPKLKDLSKSIYSLLWKFRLSGVINFNIDRLATRAFSEVRTGEQYVEFSAKDAGRYIPAITDQRYFMANLHGDIDDAASWTFTSSELNNLMRNNAHKQFFKTAITCCTLVFVGISADDYSISSHFKECVQDGIAMPEHFWITTRSDSKTRAVADDCGIQTILYENVSGDHSETKEILKFILRSSPAEKIAYPITPDTESRPLFLSCDQIEELGRPEARDALNQYAAHILNGGDDSKYSLYEKFRRDYESAIHYASFVSPNNGNNKLLGYTIEKEMTQGAFGKIYEAHDKHNNPCIIKILKSEAWDNPERLQSFRRGVTSMKILTQRRVKGIVPYIDAGEIPPFAVMEYIHGDNLEEIVRKNALNKWEDRLFVAKEIAETVLRAHKLPERVLHRDLRPSNIMIRNSWERDLWEVVLLDFDLSWHREAREVSISSPGVENGYLAPELISRDAKNPTRNALVDSYGLGMTFYYLGCKQRPNAFQTSSVNWKSDLYTSITNNKYAKWETLPRRFARLILHTTLPAQSERWDVTRICSELTKLIKCANGNVAEIPTDCVAEEIMYQCISKEYTYDLPSQLTYKFSNVICKINVEDETDSILFELTKAHDGSQNYGDLRNSAPKVKEQLTKHLDPNKWNIRSLVIEPYQIRAVWSIQASRIKANINDYKSSLNRIMQVISS